MASAAAAALARRRTFSTAASFFLRNLPHPQPPPPPRMSIPPPHRLPRMPPISPCSVIIINPTPPALLPNTPTTTTAAAAAPSFTIPPHYYHLPPQPEENVNNYHGPHHVFDLPNPAVIRYGHPFLKWGNPNLFEMKSDDEKCMVTVDMPGINKQGLKVWFENKRFLKIVGQQQMEDEDVHHHHHDGAHEMMKEEARAYDVTVDLLQEAEILKKEEAMAELKNGVLIIIIPKIKLQEIKDVVHVDVA